MRNPRVVVVLGSVLFVLAPQAPGNPIDVTGPADPIWLVNGTNDGDSNAGPPPANEVVSHAIDNYTQKYLNFLDLGSGFIVTPSLGASVVNALRFYTANDAEPRDPASFEFFGSNDVGADPSVFLYALIASGPLSLPVGRNPGGTIPIDPSTQFLQEVSFSNAAAYTTYKVTFPTLKDAASANSMQIGEVELLGTPIPEPGMVALMLASLVAASLRLRRR